MHDPSDGGCGCGCGLFAAHFEQQAVAPMEWQVDQPAKAVEATTEHYRIEWHGTQADADEAGKVLEAAWPLYKKFFGAEPKLKKDEKLNLRMFADQPSWAASIRADGGAVPSVAGGLYLPHSKVAYLYRQPTIWFTRTLMLHEALHQFHYLATTNNQSIKYYWYVEGIAEYLSRHTWDGEKLQIGQLPTLSLENYWAKALESVSKQDFSLSKLVNGEYEPGRPESMAVVAWLHESDAKRQQRFTKMRSLIDRGGDSGSAFRSNIGDPAKLQKDLVEWLKQKQEPMVPTWNEWDNLAPASVRGIAPTVWTVSRTSGKSDWIQANILGRKPENGEWQAGLLLNFATDKDFTVATINQAGQLYVARCKDGNWSNLPVTGQPGKPEAPHQHLMRAERKDGKVSWLVNGSEIGSYELPDGHMGLSAYRCSMDFSQISFEGYPPAPAKEPKGRKSGKR